MWKRTQSSNKSTVANTSSVLIYFHGHVRNEAKQTQMLQIIKKGLVRVRTQFRGHIQNICSLFSVYPYTCIQVCDVVLRRESFYPILHTQ